MKKQKQCAAFTTNKNLGRVYVFHRFDQSEEQCRDFGVYPSDISDQLRKLNIVVIFREAKLTISFIETKDEDI